MLTITRKHGQRVVLERDGEVLATIQVNDPRHGKVRLSFDAPHSVVIVSEERRRRPRPTEATP